jgi:hypothetical protein
MSRFKKSAQACAAALTLFGVMGLSGVNAQASTVAILGGTLNTGVNTTITTTPYTPYAGSSHFIDARSDIGRWRENGYFSDWSTTPTNTVLAWTFDSPASAFPCGVGCTNFALGTAVVNFYVVDMTGYVPTATSYAADKAKIETGALFASFSGNFNAANEYCLSYPLYWSCGSNPGTLTITGGAAAPYLPSTASFSLGLYYDRATAITTNFGSFSANFVAAAAVPEPSHLSLLLAGVVALGLWQRRAVRPR